MFLDSITRLFDRDIGKVIEEISKYENEADLWTLPSGINNSAGTLALHIAGNLQHFVGAILGGSGYQRDRAAEFELREVPKKKILQELTQSKEIVNQTLESLDAASMENDYPQNIFDGPVSNYFMLIHLHGHLNYHLGQINYHRRLLVS